jgi:phosphatidylserine decarboxylase
MQIAGLIARRIICRIQPGDEVQKGQRFGVICFGSRVDTYLPANAVISVAAGDHVKAGATIIARMP